MKVTKLYNDVAFAKDEVVNQGVNIAACAGLSTAIIESDFQDAIDFVNNIKSNRTEIYWIISYVQSKMKDFNAIEVQHTPRSCNAITYSLDRLVLEKCETIVWVGSYP